MFAAMETLRARDLRAALEFIETAWSLADTRAFTLQTLTALAELIPADIIGYCVLDRVRRRELDYVGTDADDQYDEQLFWSIVDEHPLCRHSQAYADFSAKRISDIISRRRFLNSRTYAEWLRPVGIEAELEAGIAPSRAITRTFILSRSQGDFSVRDRDLLELLRPHLRRIHEMTELRHALSDPEPEALNHLTTREREVLELVSAGMTNAAVAQRLWISPATVKKHLENIYEKLGVSNRTAATANVATH
jgi:DNA-binding CsgD family transcriptional regulator